MHSTYVKPTFALATALFLLFLLVGGCKDNPVEAADDVAENRIQAAALGGLETGIAGGVIPFADTEVFFEMNTTDNDLGLQIFLDAEGWETVRIEDPGGTMIARFNAAGPFADLGITELRLESAEPSPAEVLALFDPGTYQFTGTTVNGDQLVGEGELSHDMPTPPTFSPSDGEEVDPEEVEIEWEAPGAELVEIIIESDDSEAVFDVIVEAGTESLDIPEQFLEPETEYKIEVLSISENGNKTITESTFITSAGDDDDDDDDDGDDDDDD